MNSEDNKGSTKRAILDIEDKDEEEVTVKLEQEYEANRVYQEDNKPGKVTNSEDQKDGGEAASLVPSSSKTE